MRRRAFTMLEVLVGSGVLLLMVVMASIASIGYLRAYRHYTKQAEKVMERLVRCGDPRYGLSLLTALTVTFTWRCRHSILKSLVARKCLQLETAQLLKSWPLRRN